MTDPTARLACYDNIRNALRDAKPGSQDYYRKRVGTYSVGSGGMIPTLLSGDLIIAQKLYYRTHAPQRGDVVVFKLPSDPSIDYIKRVVGLPGDSIQMKAGELYIDGAVVPRKRIADYLYPEGDGTLVPLRQYLETLPNGVQYQIIKLGNNGPLDNTQVYHVPPNDYFMMGDNRDNSEDSRVLSAVGYVPAQTIIGRADVVYWPLDRLGIEIQ